MGKQNGVRMGGRVGKWRREWMHCERDVNWRVVSGRGERAYGKRGGDRMRHERIRGK